MGQFGMLAQQRRDEAARLGASSSSLYANAQQRLELKIRHAYVLR